MSIVSFVFYLFWLTIYLLDKKRWKTENTPFLEKVEPEKDLRF